MYQYNLEQSFSNPFSLSTIYIMRLNKQSMTFIWWCLSPWDHVAGAIKETVAVSEPILVLEGKLKVLLRGQEEETRNIKHPDVLPVLKRTLNPVWCDIVHWHSLDSLSKICFRDAQAEGPIHHNFPRVNYHTHAAFRAHIARAYKEPSVPSECARFLKTVSGNRKDCDVGGKLQTLLLLQLLYLRNQRERRRSKERQIICRQHYLFSSKPAKAIISRDLEKTNRMECQSFRIVSKAVVPMATCPSE